MTTKNTDTPTPRKKRLRLTSVEAVRAYLAGCLQRLENGEIDDKAAKTRGYLAQLLARIIEGSDLEQRIKTLEEKENL